MTENDELQPVRIGGLLQFGANALHQVELVARIEARRNVVENHEARRALMLDRGGKKDRAGDGVAIASSTTAIAPDAMQSMKIGEQQLWDLF